MRNNNHRKEQSNKPLVNEQIRAREIRLITETGENVGVVSKQEALTRANDAGLDLVQIGEQDEFVIAKIMDFGKHLYTKKKQQHEAKKKQKVIQIKEIKMRPAIGDQDYKIKFNRAVGFLKEGKRVKFTLQFRGRQMIMMRELGDKHFSRIHQDLLKQDLGPLVEEILQRGRPFWSKIYYVKGS